MRKYVNQFLGVSIMFSIPTKRNPLWYLTISILPIALFFIFYMVGGMNMSFQAMLGALVAFALSAGIVSLPQLVVFLKVRKFQDMFVASPTHPISYALGIAFSRLIYVSPVIIVVFVILLANGIIKPLAILPTMAVLFVAWLTGSLIGFTMATYVSNILYISSIANMAGMVVNLLPPVYYPMSFVPESLRQWALLFPSSSAAELIRLINGQSDPALVGHLSCWVVLSAYIVLAVLLVTYKSRWREA